jgi:hypothetical protein
MVSTEDAIERSSALLVTWCLLGASCHAIRANDAEFTAIVTDPGHRGCTSGKQRQGGVDSTFCVTKSTDWSVPEPLHHSV